MLCVEATWVREWTERAETVGLSFGLRWTDTVRTVAAVLLSSSRALGTYNEMGLSK